MVQLRYHSLRSRTHIRLLEIQPGAWNSPIVAYFTQADIAADHVPLYECLSYTWDLPGISEETMYIDNYKKGVLPTLYAFLKKLRAEKAPRTLWADFLCMNQEDDIEKGFQVRLMGMMYKRASCVLAWVGEHKNRSERLFRGWPSKSVRRHRFSSSLSSREQAYRKSVWVPFLSRRYWSRTWIIQELALAKDVIVYCGNDSISWEDLIESRTRAPKTHWLSARRSQRRRGYPEWDLDGIEFGLDYSDQLHVVRTVRLRVLTDPSLISLVREYGLMTECSVTKDTIYAFLSMTGDPIASQIVPNYGATTAEVFLEFWAKHFETPGASSNKAMRDPGPYMLLFAFGYEDDCQLADYLLDSFEVECMVMFYNSASRNKPLSVYYQTYLNAVQALWDGGEHPSAKAKAKPTDRYPPRLRYNLPRKVRWYKPRKEGPGGRLYLTEVERESDNFRRYNEHREQLSQCRANLQARGQWPSDRRRMTLVGHKLPVHNNGLNAQTPKRKSRLPLKDYNFFQ